MVDKMVLLFFIENLVFITAFFKARDNMRSLNVGETTSKTISPIALFHTKFFKNPVVPSIDMALQLKKSFGLQLMKIPVEP